MIAQKHSQPFPKLREIDHISHLNPEKIRNILIIVDNIWGAGDVLYLTPLAGLLSGKFPKAKGSVDVISPHKSLWELDGQARAMNIDSINVDGSIKSALNGRQYDLVVCFVPGDIYLNRAEKWFQGVGTSGHRDNVLAFSLSESIAPRYLRNGRFVIEDKPSIKGPEVINYPTRLAAVMRNLGLNVKGGHRPSVRVDEHVVDETRRRILDEITSQGGVKVGDETKVITVNPFTLVPQKQFDPPFLAESAVGMLSWAGGRDCAVCVLPGHRPDKDAVSTEIAGLVRGGAPKPKFAKLDYTGGDTLKQLVYFLAASDVVVGPDTFTQHAADALDRHSLTLFKSGDEKALREYHPTGGRCFVLEGYTDHFPGIVDAGAVSKAVSAIVGLQRKEPIFKREHTLGGKLAVKILKATDGLMDLVDYADPEVKTSMRSMMRDVGRLMPLLTEEHRILARGNNEHPNALSQVEFLETLVERSSDLKVSFNEYWLPSNLHQMLRLACGR